MAHIITKINDLRRIEQIALKELESVSKGRWYSGKELDIDRLQKVARDAKIKRLELELNEK